MSCYCEVVVYRPIIRRPVIPIAYGHGEGTVDINPWEVTFSYAIPKDLRRQISIGQLVEVPFRSGTLQSVIISLTETPPPDIDVRPLSSILDPKPVTTPAQITLARWLSAHYLAHLSNCVWLFLPPGIRRLPQTVVEALPKKKPPPNLDARAHALLLYLRAKEEPAPVTDLEVEPLKTLSDMQLIRTRQRLALPRVRPKIDRTVELIATPDDITAALPTLGRPSKQADVLLYLAAQEDPLPAVKDVLTAVGCTQGPVDTLAERGWVKVTPRRSLVATTLSGAAAEAALNGLERAPAQRAALNSLRKHPGPVATSHVNASAATLSALENKGYLRRWTDPAAVTLTLDYDELLDAVLELKRATRHVAVLDVLTQEQGRVWVGWVYAQTDATLDTLRDLATAGLISLDEARRWRDPLADLTFVLKQPPRLTPEQQAVWRVVQQEMQESARSRRFDVQSVSPGAEPHSSTFLLHGVTGSGKTEIYLRAVEEALSWDRGAIVLVPEIALAAQTVQRVAARFPGKVAVWHSNLSLGERFDTWQRVRDGELPVVVGARSALFAPVPNLGVIVVDEEHEPAYKQARAPRYHAREVALQLGRLTGAIVILGSATPDVTTFRRAERGEFRLLSLPKRVLAHRQHLAIQAEVAETVLPSSVGYPLHPSSDVLRTLPLPPVEVVDLREELKAGNRTIFSRALQRAIRETLDADHQAILFLNRRGAATFVLCRDCGHALRCPRCEMPLTYHAEDEALLCHHCSSRQPNPNRCPACRGSHIRYFGLGTQRVEAVVRDMFPDARPLRWDLDAVRTRGSHTALLQQFVEGRANVLVGTQMIAKGLDLPRVTLVGVVSADTALYLPDFRAAERSFQLLMQVAGRAGRSPLGGRVVVQTYSPELSVIQAAANHDYGTFYRKELGTRQQSGYPPFKRLARLVFTGAGAKRAESEAKRMARLLRTHVARWGEPGVEIVGPAPCFYRKLRGQHRWHVLIRAEKPEALLRPITLPLGWRVDVDPMEFL